MIEDAYQKYRGKGQMQEPYPVCSTKWALKLVGLA